MDELHYLVTSPSLPTIIAFTETWLYSSISESEVQLPCYRLFRRDRTRQGGGVALCVYETVSIKVTFSHSVAELLSVTVNSPTGSLQFTVVYRPPGLDGDLSVLDAALLSLQHPCASHAVIVGDFNVDLSKPHSTSALDLLATFAGYGLHQVVQEPTRLAGCRHSLLDLVLCTRVSMICDLSINCPLGTSDHNSIAICLTVDRPQVQRCMRRVWMYQKADFEAINVALEESLFPKDSISTWSVDQAWTTFESMFLSVIKHFIPCRTVPSRRTQPPWINKEGVAVYISGTRHGELLRPVTPLNGGRCSGSFETVLSRLYGPPNT